MKFSAQYADLFFTIERTVRKQKQCSLSQMKEELSKVHESFVLCKELQEKLINCLEL